VRLRHRLHRLRPAHLEPAAAIDTAVAAALATTGTTVLVDVRDLLRRGPPRTSRGVVPHRTMVDRRRSRGTARGALRRARHTPRPTQSAVAAHTSRAALVPALGATAALDAVAAFAPVTDTTEHATPSAVVACRVWRRATAQPPCSAVAPFSQFYHHPRQSLCVECGQLPA